MNPGARKTFIVAALGCLMGCATPYGPFSEGSGTGGYVDKKIADGKYYIESLTNVVAGPEKAMEYWHRRAAELCQGKPYTDDAVLSSKRNATYGGGLPGAMVVHDWPLVVGTATCAN